MSGSGPFTEDPRLPAVAEPMQPWRVLLIQHTNDADGRCGVCGYGSCDLWQRATARLAEEDRWAEARAAVRLWGG
jgi:hypothetical protein